MLRVVLGGSALALCACDDPSDAKDDEYKCIETVQELAGLDAPVPDGPTVRELVGKSLGTRGFTLQGPPNQKPLTTYTPNSDGVKGTLDLAYVSGKVRYIQATRPEIPKGLQLDVYCPNRLEVDVTMKLRSEDGAFAEQVPAIISRELNAAQNPDKVDPERARQAQLTVDFAQHQRAGTFAIQTPPDFTPENTESHALDFRVLWEDDVIKQSSLSATWLSKPEPESFGGASQFGAQMDVYNFVFAAPIVNP